MITAQISGISSYLPDNRLGNEELANIFSGWTPEKIERKLGIKTRPIVSEGETALDMAVKAGQKLFDSGICKPDQIDFVVLCTQSPDYFLPTSACILQNKLGIPVQSGAFDLNLGCSGYIYSLAVCKGLVESGLAKNILLVTSETYSRYINKKDRASRPLFGDGATASLINADFDAPDHDYRLGEFHFGTDGSGANLLMVPAGAQRLAKSEETAREYTDSSGAVRTKNDLYMNGPGIFTFSIDRIPPLVEEYRRYCQEKNIEIESYIFHQANKYMLDRLRDLCCIDKNKYFNNMLDRGNTVSSSIPIAIIDAMASGFLRKEQLALLIGFGVGLSWGGCLIRLPEHFRFVS